jgi:hypothetical protein
MTPKLENGSERQEFPYGADEMNLDYAPETIEVILKKIEIGMNRAFTNEYLMNVKTYTDYDVLSGTTQVSVRGYIWGEELVDVSFPRDWWQAFKDRWFPQWLKRRFPVMKTRIEGMAYFPKLQLPDQEYEYVRHFKVFR